ncbi:TPA: MobT family relaxase [Clostridioides difficile]
MADCDNRRKISQISINTRLGVCRLNESAFITALKEKRLSYGVSQTRLAIMAGISREHLNRIEAGKVKLTDDMQDKLMEAVEKFNPDAPMFLLFDYVRIRFPTLDIQHVIRDILKLNVDYMLHEDYGHYKYTEHYYLGDVFVYTSQDEEKGTLLELKGKGCRQFESYLLAQGRSWYDFLMDALVEGGVMKRLDLAINDRAGILDIPDLTAKCNREECVSLFRSFKSYASGELVKHNEQDKAGMGHTLYIGSLKSEVYFCCYEKNYEQYAKLGIPTSEAPIKNRFEIRLKDERAYYAVRELLTHYDAEQTAFSIINHYIRFVDREPEKRKTDWKLNDRWAWFIGKDRPPVKLTTDPEPYTLERTLGWISRQVAPTLKMLKKIDAGNSTSYLKEIEDNAKLTEKHLQIIRQQTAETEELITE